MHYIKNRKRAAGYLAIFDPEATTVKDMFSFSTKKPPISFNTREDASTYVKEVRKYLHATKHLEYTDRIKILNFADKLYVV